jgi:hypothetical protein
MSVIVYQNALSDLNTHPNLTSQEVLKHRGKGHKVCTHRELNP